MTTHQFVKDKDNTPGLPYFSTAPEASEYLTISSESCVFTVSMTPTGCCTVEDVLDVGMGALEDRREFTAATAPAPSTAPEANIARCTSVPLAMVRTLPGVVDRMYTVYRNLGLSGYVIWRSCLCTATYPYRIEERGKKSYLHVLQAYSISAGNNMKPTPTDSRLTEK